jgi:hypothetical protein
LLLTIGRDHRDVATVRARVEEFDVLTARGLARPIAPVYGAPVAFELTDRGEYAVLCVLALVAPTVPT